MSNNSFIIIFLFVKIITINNNDNNNIHMSHNFGCGESLEVPSTVV